MPSASSLSLLAPMEPIASVRFSDAGVPVAITVTIPIAIVAPAEHGVVFERFFQETFLLEPMGESTPAASIISSALPSQAAIGRASAPLAPQASLASLAPVAASAPESATLTAVPPAAAITPATVASASGVGSSGAATTTAFGALPATQAVAPAPATANSVTPEAAPTATLSSTTPSTTGATPLASIGYFLGSDSAAQDNMDEETMPPADNNPAPAATPPVNGEPDRAIDSGAAMRSDDADDTVTPAGTADDGPQQDSVVTSDRSIALAALSAGIGLSSGAVAPEDDATRTRRSGRRRRRVDA